MIDTTVIVQHSLMYGGVYAFVLAGLILFSVWLNVEIWLNDFPDAVKVRFGPMSAKAKKQRAWFSLIFFPVVFGFPLVALGQLAGEIGNVSFAAAFLTTFIMVFLFNLADLLIVDWFFGVLLQPSFFILPGTADMTEYHNYGYQLRYHFRAFLIGIGFCLVMGLVMGGVGSLIW